jgi:hypothetical protein
MECGINGNELRRSSLSLASVMARKRNRNRALSLCSNSLSLCSMSQHGNQWSTQPTNMKSMLNIASALAASGAWNKRSP